MSVFVYLGGTDRLPPNYKPPMHSKAWTNQLCTYSMGLNTQRQERKHYLDTLKQLRSNAQKYADEYSNLVSRLASSLLKAYPDVLEYPDLNHVLQGTAFEDLSSWHERSVLWTKQATVIERVLESVEEKYLSVPCLKLLVQIIAQIDRVLKDPERIGLALQLFSEIEIQ